MKVRTYEVSFAYGLINPIEKKMKISSSNDLTEKFILDEICRKNTNYRDRIKILSVLLIGEKDLEEPKIQNQSDNIQEENIPFNW